MPVRYDNPNRTRILDDAVQIKNTRRTVAQQRIIARVRERNRFTLPVSGLECFLFRRAAFGRECSCFLKEDRKNPTTKCRVCYGTGFVGGYVPFGFDNQVVDVTLPGLFSENMVVNGERLPNTFFLKKGATNGYIQTPTFDLRPLIDTWTQRLQLMPGTDDTVVSVSFFDGENLQPFEQFEEKVKDGLQETYLRFQFSRTTETNKPTQFESFQLRFLTSPLEEAIVFFDKSERTSSKSLEEFGFVDEIRGISLWTNYRPKVSSHDFIEFVNTGERFKVISVSQITIQGEELSQVVDVRAIQPDEIYTKVL